MCPPLQSLRASPLLSLSNEPPEYSVEADLQRFPLLLTRLAENSLVVAESLKDNYFKNTAHFVGHLRQTLVEYRAGLRSEPICQVYPVNAPDWSQLQGEVVTFIDGGVGQVNLASRVPLLLRVGSYTVRTGDRQLSTRERFGYYPVILGDLEGGSRERSDFVDIVRITAELIGGLSALQREPNLGVLMFHGPLVYPMSKYAGHTPFTESDIDLFLDRYALDRTMAAQLKQDFLREAELDLYPQLTDHSDEWVRRRVFEPLSWIAFLYRRLIALARSRTPTPLIVGVIERGTSREFCEKVLLRRVFRGLRANGRGDYFNALYGRRDLTSPKAVMDRLGYTDALLLSTLLEAGQYSEPWQVRKAENLQAEDLCLPGESGPMRVNFPALRSEKIGFPVVQAAYVRAAETAEPVRIEVFEALGANQIPEAARRAVLYSRLLPGYCFPVGIDIADKYAHIPAWLTRAYGKLIQLHLGVSLQRGEISDAEMRRLLVQSIYMTKRDWLFRPQVF